MIISNKVPLRYILKKTWINLVAVAIFSTVIYVITLYTDFFVIPSSIPAFLGTAISLVLAFKLSQSYDRWWEARKIWGAIVNDSRTLVLQVLNFINVDKSDSIIKTLAYRQIALCYAIGDHLRCVDSSQAIEKFLNESEFQTIQKQRHIPLALLQKHGEDFSYLHLSNRINDYQQIQLDDTLVRLNGSLGKCERIKNTVFPTTYRLYLHFFIYLFIAFLSISLAETKGAWQIILTILISIPFLILEKASNNLQDPFENRPTDTPVTTISKNIELSIKQLIDDSNIPELESDQNFYIL